MSNKISRTEFLKRGTLLTAGVSVAALGGGIIFSENAKANNLRNNSNKATWPMAYPVGGLDPEAARIAAHDAFWSGKGCSYATFEGILSLLKDSEDPSNTFNGVPSELMISGHGGGVGWGATCGVLAGAQAAISLVCAKADSDVLVNELYGWYTQTAFPTTTANTVAIANGYGINTYNMDLPQSTSNSPLCHVSVTTWCTTNNYGVNANERKERCARLCGDTAAKAVEILNAKYAGTFTAEYVPPAIIATCNTCHGPSTLEDDVSAKMDCSSCHGSDVYPNHTTGEKSITETDFQIKQNYPNPFNDGTTIEFNIAQSEYVTIEIVNLNGQHIKTLVKNQYYTPGTYTVEWDGNNANGTKAVSGMYMYSFRTLNSIKTVSMIKI